MFRKLASHLSYANVVSTLCLFALLGGGAYAAGLAKNSVGSKQIKDGQVKSVDVKDNALTGTDIDETSLTLPQGPPGPKGDPGQDGEDGAPGVNGSPDTAGEVLAKLLSIDGPGSGLDADTLDGQTSSYFGHTISNYDAFTAPFQAGQQVIVTRDTFLVIPEVGRFEARCSNNDGQVAAEFVFHNTSGGEETVWAGNSVPRFPPANGTIDTDTAGVGSTHSHWLIAKPSGSPVVSVELGEAEADGSSCRFLAQAVISG